MSEDKFCLQGNEYVSKGLFEMAIAQYSLAIEFNPHCDQAYSGRALVYCLYLRDLYDEALSDFTKAIELNPSNLISYHGRGMIYYMKELYDLALRDFSTVLEMNPGWGAGLYLSRGDIFLKLGQFREAETDFSKAIALNPESSRAYYNRAMSCFHQKQYEKALRDVRSAEELGIDRGSSETDPDFLLWLQSVTPDKKILETVCKEDFTTVQNDEVMEGNVKEDVIIVQDSKIPELVRKGNVSVINFPTAHKALKSAGII